MWRLSAPSRQSSFGKTVALGLPTLTTARPRFSRFGHLGSLRLLLTRGFNLALSSLSTRDSAATGELLILRRWLARWQQELFLYTVPSLSALPNYSLNLSRYGMPRLAATASRWHCACAASHVMPPLSG
jgi:hypothetical protein